MEKLFKHTFSGRSPNPSVDLSAKSSCLPLAQLPVLGFYRLGLARWHGGYLEVWEICVGWTVAFEIIVGRMIIARWLKRVCSVTLTNKVDQSSLMTDQKFFFGQLLVSTLFFLEYYPISRTDCQEGVVNFRFPDKSNIAKVRLECESDRTTK